MSDSPQASQVWLDALEVAAAHAAAHCFHVPPHWMPPSQKSVTLTKHSIQKREAKPSRLERLTFGVRSGSRKARQPAAA